MLSMIALLQDTAAAGADKGFGLIGAGLAAGMDRDPSIATAARAAAEALLDASL